MAMKIKKMLGHVKGVIDYGASDKQKNLEFKFDIDIEELYDLDLSEQDLMTKISFFYSDRAKEFLNIECYSTRIYTIGLGSATNFAVLEYLA